MMPRCLLVACLLLLSATIASGESASPAPVLVLNASGLDLEQRHTAASLQGIANRSPDGPKVFVPRGRWDEAWLEYALLFSPRPTTRVSLDELLEALKPQLTGQVLYDPAQSYTLDVATAAAGVRDAVISARDLGLPTLYDFRNRWPSADEAYRWAATALLPKASRTHLAVLPAESATLRDYAVQQRMFTISPALTQQNDTLMDVLYHFSPGATVLGERPASLMPTLSQLSFSFVSAAEAPNLSFYSTLAGDRRFFQYLGHLEPTAPRYLTLILDCSDLSFAISRMPDLWEQSTRGALPLGWAISDALAVAAPPLAHRYYADAYRSGTDQFVLSASEAGETTLARAADLLDAHTALYYPASSSEDLASTVARLGSEGHLRGVFLLTGYDQPPAIYRGTPALATPRVDSVQQAITYLNRIPLERRFVALCLDARSLGPADAAHIAAHVARRYVVIPPAELMTLMLSAAQLTPAGASELAVTSVQYPEGVLDSTSPVPVKAEIAAPEGLGIASASVVYRHANSRFAFNQQLLTTPAGLATTLPPIRWGGQLELKVRAVDTKGGIAWSPLWTVNIAREDADQDGASDAEEALLLTDPRNPDTDGDGVTDADDPHPVEFDHSPSWFFGPLSPPHEAPYLTDPAESEASDSGRILPPGRSATYWLPTGRLPPGGSAVVRVEANGPAVIAMGSEPGKLVGQFEGQITWRWHSSAISPPGYSSNVYLRITCPQEAASPLTLSILGLVSAPEAPSITRLRRAPAHPGPEQPITLSALVFSPTGLAEVALVYRVAGRGQITLPMAAQGQRYYAVIPALDNQDLLEYWIVARDTAGNVHSTPMTSVWVGGRGREIVSLLARRDFVGAWRPSPEWHDAASSAPQAGLQETAPVNLTGGAYTLWLLAGGRGNGLAVSVDGTRVGAIESARPDGWQRIGRVRLEAGRHRVSVTSEWVSQYETWSAPRYGALVLSTDSTFAPPADQVFDVVNSLVLLSPDTREPLTGTVELKATGAGNLLGVQFSVDGAMVRRVSGPPFSLSLGTSRYENGPHTLRLEAVDRTGPTGLILEVPITIANP